MHRSEHSFPLSQSTSLNDQIHKRAISVALLLFLCLIVISQSSCGNDREAAIAPASKSSPSDVLSQTAKDKYESGVRGLHYFIEDGAGRRFCRNHQFGKDAHVKLHIRSNTNGHLVVCSLGTDKKRRPIYPKPEAQGVEKYKIAAGEWFTQASLVPLVAPAQYHVFFSPSDDNLENIVGITDGTKLCEEIKREVISEKNNPHDDNPKEPGLGTYVVSPNGGKFGFKIELKQR